MVAELAIDHYGTADMSFEDAWLPLRNLFVLVFSNHVLNRLLLHLSIKVGGQAYYRLLNFGIIITRVEIGISGHIVCLQLLVQLLVNYIRSDCYFCIRCLFHCYFKYI